MQNVKRALDAQSRRLGGADAMVEVGETWGVAGQFEDPVSRWPRSISWVKVARCRVVHCALAVAENRKDAESQLK